MIRAARTNLRAHSKHIRSTCVSRSFSSSSDSIVDKVKEFFVFNPKAKPFVNYAESTDLVDKAYRTPAPMSRGTDIDVPVVENTDDLYNNQYYTRDTKRNNRDPIYVISAEAKKLLPASLPEPTGSPGNKNPAVLRYDPDGTRSAMTTTTPAMQEVLARRAGKSHVPQPWWAKDANSLKEEAKAKGIPPLFGKPATWSKTEFDGKW